MPTRNVNLTDELDRMVLAKVATGRYENAREVIRAAVDEGDSSGIARGAVFHTRPKEIESSRRTAIAMSTLRFHAAANLTCWISPRACDDIRPGLRRMECGGASSFAGR